MHLDTSLPIEKEMPVNCEKTDWDKCVICQGCKDETLHCPADSTRNDKGQGYVTVAQNIQTLYNLHDMPVKIDPERLAEDGNDIAATFVAHEAKWHLSCKLLFNNTQVLRANKRKLKETHPDNDNKSAKRLKRNSAGAYDNVEYMPLCFFCDKPEGPGDSLHDASTFRIDFRVKEAIFELQDMDLLTKVSSSDLIALEAKYHSKCLVALYNRLRTARESQSNSNVDKIAKGIALAELLQYIEDAKYDEEKAVVFRLADLVRLYGERLKQLGADVPKRIHSTKLKDRILRHFSDIREQRDGIHTLLAFDKDIGLAIKRACEADYDDEAIHLAKAASAVRKDMLDLKQTFDGTFKTNCQEEAVPQSLQTLVNMILNGPNIKAQSDVTLSSHQAMLSICEIIQYNSIKRRGETSTQVYHSKCRDTPLPVYLGISIHGKTRNRELIDILFKLGLSISYDRVLSISTDLANTMIKKFEEENVVCGSRLRKHLFTKGAVDNVDKNLTSSTAKGAFHGTSISIFQDITSDNKGELRGIVGIDPECQGSGTIKALPDNYSIVPAASLSQKKPPIPQSVGPVGTDMSSLQDARQSEFRYIY
jgi:hypothetical protein